MEILLVCVPNHSNLSPQLVGMCVFTSFYPAIDSCRNDVDFFYL